MNDKNMPDDAQRNGSNDCIDTGNSLLSSSINLNAQEFARNFTDVLQKNVSQINTKQTAVLTSTILGSSIETIHNLNPSHPRNESIELSGSADKRKEWLCESEYNVKAVPPKGEPLDLQLLDEKAENGKPLLNQESELHGNRQRNEDLKKLVNHSHPAVVNSFVFRSKSRDNIDKNIAELSKKASGLDGEIVITNIYCPNGENCNNSIIRSVVAKDGNITWDSKE